MTQCWNSCISLLPHKIEPPAALSTKTLSRTANTRADRLVVNLVGHLYNLNMCHGTKSGEIKQPGHTKRWHFWSPNATKTPCWAEWIPHDDQLMGLKAQEDVGECKAGWVGWVGLGSRGSTVLYTKRELFKAFCNFPFGKDSFFFLRGPLCNLCLCVCAHIFFGVSILFKVSTVIKKQDRYIYICIYSFTYTQYTQDDSIGLRLFLLFQFGKFQIQVPDSSRWFFFLLAGGWSTVGSRWILATKTVPWQPRDTRRQRERLPGPSGSTGFVWRTIWILQHSFITHYFISIPHLFHHNFHHHDQIEMKQLDNDTDLNFLISHGKLTHGTAMEVVMRQWSRNLTKPVEIFLNHAEAQLNKTWSSPIQISTHYLDFHGLPSCMWNMEDAVPAGHTSVWGKLREAEWWWDLKVSSFVYLLSFLATPLKINGWNLKKKKQLNRKIIWTIPSWLWVPC